MKTNEILIIGGVIAASAVAVYELFINNQSPTTGTGLTTSGGVGGNAYTNPKTAIPVNTQNPATILNITLPTGTSLVAPGSATIPTNTIVNVGETAPNGGISGVMTYTTPQTAASTISINNGFVSGPGVSTQQIQPYSQAAQNYAQVLSGQYHPVATNKNNTNNPLSNGVVGGIFTVNAPAQSA